MRATPPTHANLADLSAGAGADPQPAPAARARRRGLLCSRRGEERALALSPPPISTPSFAGSQQFSPRGLPRDDAFRLSGGDGPAGKSNHKTAVSNANSPVSNATTPSALKHQRRLERKDAHLYRNHALLLTPRRRPCRWRHARRVARRDWRVRRRRLSRLRRGLGGARCGAEPPPRDGRAVARSSAERAGRRSGHPAARDSVCAPWAGVLLR